MANILKALNLGKSYANRRVVRDVSFEIKKGQIVGILGPNGAGKTTSFYMITGLIKPDYGTIHLDDNDITHFPMYMRSRMGISYLPQESSIFRGLSVENNILAILETHITDEFEKNNTLEELLASFSISHLRRTQSVALSGGERRRLEIARALATKPNFLLLDEPLAGVDPISVNELKEIILQLKQKNIGIIITDHNVREALSILDYAYVIHEGLVLTHGTPADIVKNEAVRTNYLGDNFEYNS
jgi:lipopolysaccharide export system ATP-binding protein